MVALGRDPFLIWRQRAFFWYDRLEDVSSTMRTPKLTRATAFVLLPLALLVRQAQAQDGHVSIVPRVGVHSEEGTRVSLARFDPDAGFGIHGGGAELGETPIVGVGVDVDLPPRWLDLRLALDRTVGGDIVSTGPPFQTQGSLTTVGTDIVFRPLSSARPLRPLLAVGWGMTRFSMNGQQIPDVIVWERTRIEGALRLGVGLDLHLGPSILRLEVMDSIGLMGIGGSGRVLPEREEVQASLGGGVPNDFLITAGTVIPLR